MSAYTPESGHRSKHAECPLSARNEHRHRAHPSKTGTAVRRVVFDAKDRASVDALHSQVNPRVRTSSAPEKFSTGQGRVTASSLSIQKGGFSQLLLAWQITRMPLEIRDMPRKIAHVNLNAVDVAQTNAFLIDDLGFKLVDK